MSEETKEAVFERRPGLARLALVVPLVALVCAEVVGLPGIEEGVGTLLGGLPGGEGVVKGTTAMLFLLPLVVLFFALAWFARRYGRCEIRGGRAVFHSPIVPGPKWVVPLSAVHGRREMRGGLLLEVPRSEGLYSLPIFAPLYVPIADDEALSLATALLDASELRREEGAPRDRFGRTRSLGWSLRAAAIVTGVSTVLALWAGLRLGTDVGFGTFVATMLGTLVAGVPLYLGSLSHVRPVFTAEGELWIAARAVAYSDLQRVAVGDGLFALESKTGRRMLARIEDGEAEARERMRERLTAAGVDPAEVVVEEPPPWARAAVGGGRFVLCALPLVLAYALGALGIGLAPTHVSLAKVCPSGAVAQVIAEDDASAPVLLFTSEVPGAADARVVVPGLWNRTLGPESAVVEIDLVRGVCSLQSSVTVQIPSGTTWIHQTAPDAMRFGAPDLEIEPDLREELVARRKFSPQIVALLQTMNSVLSMLSKKGKLPVEFSTGNQGASAWIDGRLDVAGDPDLSAWMRGETSSRAVQVAGSKRLLTWGLERGEVRFVVVSPPSVGFQTRQRVGFKHDPGGAYVSFGCQQKPFCEDCDPAVNERALRLSSNGSVLGGSSRLPDRESLWKATAQVEGGASVEEALRPLLPELWATPPAGAGQ